MHAQKVFEELFSPSGFLEEHGRDTLAYPLCGQRRGTPSSQRSTLPFSTCPSSSPLVSFPTILRNRNRVMGTWSKLISRSKRDKKPKSNDEFYYS